MGERTLPAGVAARRLRAGLVLAAGAIAVSAAAAAEPAAGKADRAEKGRLLARQYCARCHVVDDNGFGGISSTPSFRTLVRNLKDWRERFETFYARLPHPSVIRVKGHAPPTDAPPTTVQIHLDPDDLDTFVAFAETFAAD